MLKILFRNLKEGKNCTIFFASRLSPTTFGTNQTYSPTPRIAQILPNTQYLPNHWSMQIFFTSGIGHDILMKVFEDFIIFLIWAAWVVFNVYLKQKQRFSVWWLTENASISFHNGIWSITKFTEMQVSTRQLQV